MTFRLRALRRIGVQSRVLGVACVLACSSGGGTSNGSGGSASGGTPSGGGTPATGGTNAGAAGTMASGGSAGSMASGGDGATSGSGGVAGLAGLGGTAGGGDTGGSAGAGGKSMTTFFVTSDTSMTGKLGGLDGADKRCQDLAMKAGFGDHTFHAYLSTMTANAKDRIGAGPWVNANGIKVADSVAALHSAAMKGDHTIFVDEKGQDIHGQWDSSATVEHDILTGTMPDGTVQAGKTCMDWTSDSNQLNAQVGHSDGMGPGMATTGTYTSWNSAHENGPGGCANTAPKGGAGRLYCFAIN